MKFAFVALALGASAWAAPSSARAENAPPATLSAEVGEPPAAPSSGSAVASPHTSIPHVLVEWDPTNTFATSYTITRLRWNSLQWVDEGVIAEPSADFSSYHDVSMGTGRYAYLIRSVNAAGTSTPLILQVDYDPATSVPDHPVSLTATSLASTVVRLTWTEFTSNEFGFEVMRARYLGSQGWGEWKSVASLDRNSVSQVDLPPSSGVYAYLVRAYNVVGPSDWAIVTISHPTSTSVPAAAPTDLVGSVTGHDVALSWSDNSTSEYYLEVLRAKFDPESQEWSQWTSWVVGSDATTFLDTAVPYAQYAYLVRAVNALGPSSWTVTVVGVSSGTPPAAPTGLTAIKTPSTIELQWSDHATDEWGFDLQRARWDGSAWVDWASITLGADSTSRSAGRPTDGLYAYLVRSYNGNGASSWAITTVNV